MAFISTRPEIGFQAIAVTDTVQNLKIGTRTSGYDSVTYNEAEFIYLPGVANTVVGSLVIYDTYAGTTKLAVAGDRGPAAVAMSANVAGQYGWYQIGGAAVVKETGATAGAQVYVTATAGVPSATTVATDKVDGIRFKTADGTPSAGFAVAQLANPCLNGNG